MRRQNPSLTAIGIAIVRAIESERPPDERICFDPYARQLVSPFLYHLVRFFERRGWGDRRGPGVMGFLVARERHIDEFLKAQLAAGLGQLVILGAGYDARAYRFREPLAGVKVYEVDHPATQESKLKSLKRVFGSVPDYVTYVPVDFNTQTLAERLSACGYDERLRTLFIWQGVTPYLTAEAVDATLAFVAGHSAPGSAIIFDYIYKKLIDGTERRGEIAKMRGDPVLRREALTFGLPESAAVGFLEQRGYTQVQDATHDVLHTAYFTGKNAARAVSDGYAIVSAVVR